MLDTEHLAYMYHQNVTEHITVSGHRIWRIATHICTTQEQFSCQSV